MKKISLLSLLLLAGIFNVFSQPIFNPSFETWTSYSGTYGSGSYPTYWYTSDSAYIWYSNGLAGHTAIQDVADKCDGNYSVKLTTISALGIVAPGVLTNGTFTGTSISSIKGGWIDTSRSAFFTGCYEYMPVSGDIGFISAYKFRWNGSSRDTIAKAIMMTTTTVSTITDFKIPFVYYKSGQPDTIVIVIASSQGINNGQAGSVLIVDSLGLNGFFNYTGITDHTVFNNVSVFPSPASNDLNINVEYNTYKKTLYNLADATGRIVMSGVMNASKEKLNTALISNGIYMLSLRDEEGEKLYSTKVTVVH